MGKSDQKEKRLSGGPSTEANGAARQPKADDTIQEWFATLSIEEQARAMGFSDYTILSLLLRHSSLASSFSSNNNEKDGTSGSRTDKKDSKAPPSSSYWNNIVSMGYFEESIPTSTTSGDAETHRESSMEGNTEGTKADEVELNDGQQNSSSGNQSIAVGKTEETVTVPMSDAYRIRTIEVKSAPSSGKNGDDPGKSSSKSFDYASSTDAEENMMNNICIIFPSSKKLADATKQAYITLRPSYLRSHNGKDLLSSLERMLSHAIPNHSHSVTPFKKPWESLRNSVLYTAEKDKVCIPLYGLAVLRIMSAIFESYQRSIEKARRGNDASDTNLPGKADGTTSKATDDNWDIPSPISDYILHFDSFPETEEAQLLRLSKMGQCLVFPFHVLVQEVNEFTSKSPALTANDAVTQVVRKFFKDSSLGDPYEQGSSPTTILSKSNCDDSSKVSSEHMTETIPEASKPNEQISKPAGAAKKKKRKKKKRKGSHGQGQNASGKVQPSATKEEENVSQPGQHEPVLKKADVPLPSDSKEPEKEKETDRHEELGIEDSPSTISLVDEPKKMTVIKPDVSDDVTQAVPENKTSSGEDDSDSEDEEKIEPTEKETAEKAQLADETINNSRNLGHNIMAGLSTVPDIENDDSGEWETVEVKGRGNRKKAAERANQNRFQSHQHGQAQNGSNGAVSKKSKSSRSSNRKQRANMRKMVREILSNVLERVEEDVQKRRQARRETSHSGVGNWGSASAPVRGKGTVNASQEQSQSQTSNQPIDASIRDVVSQDDGATKGSRSPVRSVANRSRQRDGRSGQGQIRRGADGFMYREKTTAAGTSVDQNTVPTLPETLSAVSATSARNVAIQDTEVVQGDTSSGDSGGCSKPESSQADQEVSPPLPTLLSPENANSASSSVASSLDTSHAGHQSNHIASQQGKEKDVGYHLLDVCDRLTRDINIFMKRREYALDARRRERGAVLMALQGTVSSIWPNVCNVEMYGSCATQLDLPSSDLDVVVTGLYTPPEKMSQSSPSNGNSRNTNERRETSTAPKTNGSSSGSLSGDKLSKMALKDRNASQHVVHPHPSYSQLSQNAERIVRLAVELERQPWAVHVKAIPTASVPVIKILADPTRISGNGEWLMEAPSAAEASAVSSNERGMIEHGKTSSGTQTSMPTFPSQQALPWRGADVMNGLLKVDITFEGPEHGGIGSTKFSSRVVREFCEETGLPQDSTPAVQVLMVVKELLAQRRLNEPFSGGLSSYALLLLVISVLRERAIICQELERVERQRQLVAAENVDQRIGAFPLNHTTSSMEKPSKATQVAPQKAHNKPNWNVAARGASTDSTNKNVRVPPTSKKANAAPTSKAAPSSWASIAMKSSSQAIPAKNAKDVKSETKENSQQTKTVRKASSFADAVANGRRGHKQTNGEAGTASQPRKGESQSIQKAKSASSKSASENEPDSLSQNTPNLNSSCSAPSPQAGSAVFGSQGVHSQADESSFTERRSMFPQGFHDVTEVLCSGETTAGKLLMHFLLFYGQHFDSQSTAIDYSGTHKRDMDSNNGYSQVSPYMRRRSGGSYDPMTGMLTVDPIVVYDPLEGAETNNVARSCFAWSSIRWVFAQSYLTLLSTVEINQNHAAGQGGNARGVSRNEGKSQNTSQTDNELSHPWNGPYGHDKSGNMMIDASSPLLELLLSF